METHMGNTAPSFANPFRIKGVVRVLVGDCPYAVEPCNAEPDEDIPPPHVSAAEYYETVANAYLCGVI